MIPEFTTALLFSHARKFIQGVEDEVFIALSQIGEDFVNNARNNAGYQDRTGNLKSSVGYVILVNGNIEKRRIDTAVMDNGGVGKNTARVFSQELADQFAAEPGYTLIGFAGMHYAAAVEAKGYDVITGSTPTDTYIGKELAFLLSQD